MCVFHNTTCFLLVLQYSCTPVDIASKTVEEEESVNTDLDQDGFLEEDGDCDDENADIYPQAPDTSIDDIDQNCDGIDGPDEDGDGWVDVAAGGVDCDDADPESTLTESDPDCDGVEAWADCDDEDPFSTTILEDSDCNGFVDWPCTSLSFDGVDDIVSGPISVVLDTFTVEFWIWFPESISSSGGIVSMKEDEGDSWRILLTDECKIRAEIKKAGSGTRFVQYAGAMCDGLWHHVAFVRDEEMIRLYVNGVEGVNHSFGFSSLSLSGFIELGKTIDYTQEELFFEGKIHSLHMNGSVLFPQNFTPKQPVSNDETIFLWSLSEGSGSQVGAEFSDIVGHVDGPQWVEECPFGL